MASSIATKWIMSSNGDLQCRTCEFYASAIQSQVEGREFSLAVTARLSRMAMMELLIFQRH